MYENKVSIKEVSRNLSGDLALTLTMPGDFLHYYDDLKDNDLRLTLKKWRDKRSLDANAYFWTLCGKLSAKIGVAPEEIYWEYIKEIGDNFEIIPVKTHGVDRWIANWKSKGTGWLCESLGNSKLEGYTNVICYYGSSTYDSGQMYQLINFLVFDCKEQGIQTETPEEIERLTSLWGSKNA